MPRNPFTRKPKTADAEPIALEGDVDTRFDDVPTEDEIPAPPRMPDPLPPPPAPALGFHDGYSTALVDVGNVVGKFEKRLRSGGSLQLADVRDLRKAIDNLKPAAT